MKTAATEPKVPALRRLLRITGAAAVAGQGIAAAAALIMFLPNLVIFIVLQRQVMSTMSHSGLK